MCVDCLSTLIQCVSVKIKLMRAWVPADRPTKRNYGKYIYIYIYIPFHWHWHCDATLFHSAYYSKCVNNNNNNTTMLRICYISFQMNIYICYAYKLTTHTVSVVDRERKKKNNQMRDDTNVRWIFARFWLIIFKCTRGAKMCVEKKHETLFYYFLFILFSASFLALVQLLSWLFGDVFRLRLFFFSSLAVLLSYFATIWFGIVCWVGGWLVDWLVDWSANG